MLRKILELDVGQLLQVFTNDNRDFAFADCRVDAIEPQYFAKGDGERHKTLHAGTSASTIGVLTIPVSDKSHIAAVYRIKWGGGERGALLASNVVQLVSIRAAILYARAIPGAHRPAGP